MDESFGSRTNGDTSPLNGLEMSRRYVLMVEGHHIATLGECQQGFEIIMRTKPDIWDDLGGTLVGRKGENTQFDPEGDGRRGGHSGQLPSTHNAHDT